MLKSEFCVLQPAGSAVIDNRIFLRSPLYDLCVSIRNVNTGEKFFARARDISGSGMGFMIEREFSIGTIFEISLEIPNDFGFLKILGRVIWSRHDEFLGFTTGVVILNPRFMAVSRILKLFF